MRRAIAALARALARLLAFLLFVGLALMGGAVAVASIQGGTASPSIPALADFLGLPGLRDSVAELLGAVEADGSLAALSALGGFAAILLGGLLLVGVTTRPTERRFEADDSSEGRITAKPRPLAAATEDLVLRTDGVTASTAKAKASRSGGRLSVTALHRRQDPADLEARVAASISHLRSSFGLRTQIQVEQGDKGSRVE